MMDAMSLMDKKRIQLQNISGVQKDMQERSLITVTDDLAKTLNTINAALPRYITVLKEEIKTGPSKSLSKKEKEAWRLEKQSALDAALGLSVSYSQNPIDHLAEKLNTNIVAEDNLKVFDESVGFIGLNPQKLTADYDSTDGNERQLIEFFNENANKSVKNLTEEDFNAAQSRYRALFEAYNLTSPLDDEMNRCADNRIKFQFMSYIISKKLKDRLMNLSDKQVDIMELSKLDTYIMTTGICIGAYVAAKDKKEGKNIEGNKQRINATKMTNPRTGKMDETAVKEVRNALHGKKEGEKSIIELSNEKTTAADQKVELGFRNTGSAVSKADKKLRGTIFNNIPGGISGYFTDLGNNGLDMEEIQSNMTVKKHFKTQTGVSAASFAYGPEVNLITKNLFTMIGGQLQSPASIQYIDTMCNLLNDADVFHKSLREQAKFIIQAVLLSLSSACTDVIGGAPRSVAEECLKSILVLPRLDNVTQEERDGWAPELKESIDALTAQFEETIGTIEGLIEERRLRLDVSKKRKEKAESEAHSDTRAHADLHKRIKKFKASNGTDEGKGLTQREKLVKSFEAAFEEVKKKGLNKEALRESFFIHYSKINGFENFEQLTLKQREEAQGAVESFIRLKLREPLQEADSEFREDYISYREESGRYRLLMSSPYQPLGASRTIGEPLFRSFTSYDSFKSIQDMPDEKYERMLSGLSAHWRIDEFSPPEEIESVKAENAASLDILREATAAQYEYLFRKYGTGIENLSLSECCQHFEEIHEDCNNLQVDQNMAEKCEFFIRKDHPEDQILYARIEYFGTFFNSFRNEFNCFTDMGLSESEIKLANIRGMVPVTEAKNNLGEGVRTDVHWGEPYYKP